MPSSAFQLSPVGLGAPQAVTVPGFTPDYAGLIQGDPSYQALQQALSAAGIQNAAQRSQATQRALIQFGQVPDFNAAAGRLGLGQQSLDYLNQDVTPDIAALAQTNTANGLSTEARLQQAHDQSHLQLANTLAARGALSSGEAPYQFGNQDTQYAQAQSDALNTLLGSLGGYQQTYLTGQQTAAQQLAAALGTATATQSGLPQNQPTSAARFSYDAATGKYSGAGGTYTPHQAPGGGWVVVNDATGTAYALSPDGTIGAPTSWTPPAPPSGDGGTAPPPQSAPPPDTSGTWPSATAGIQNAINHPAPSGTWSSSLAGLQNAHDYAAPSPLRYSPQAVRRNSLL